MSEDIVRPNTRMTSWQRLARAIAPVGMALIVAACGGGKATPVSLGSQVPAGQIAGGTKSKIIQSKAAKAVAEAKEEADRKKEEERLAAEGPVAPLPPPPGQATEADPPTPGSYHYVLRGSSKTGTQTEPINEDDSKLTIGRNFQGERGAQRQSQDGAASGCGGKCTYIYQADLVSLESVAIPGGECRFEPAIQMRPVPLALTSEWSSEGSCQGVTTTIDGKVLRKETVTVGGKAVETFVIKGVAETRGGTGAQQFHQKSEYTQWFSPVYRLIVKMNGTGEATGGGITQSSTYRMTLKSLTPS